jgi:YD repeat-containing protein
MNGDLESTVCPTCHWSCPPQAQTCARCNSLLAAQTTAVKSHWTGSSWTVVAAVVFSLAMLVTFGLLWFVKFMDAQVAAAAPFQEALKIAQESSDVRSVLGDQIQVSSAPFGLRYWKYGSQFVEWHIVLSGSRSSGDLQGVANQVNGKWEYSRLVLVSKATVSQINLLPRPRLLSLPPVPPKKIYLVPFDLGTGESLEWAPDYYKAKLGIDVSLLPAIQVDPSLIDQHRQQLDSQKSFTYLRKKIPELAEDPSAVLIAVTSRDIFIPSVDWEYAQNYRYSGRFAVVSSARLQPYSFLARRNPQWSASRLQKMLTKNIAMLYFDLPMSSDYTSMPSGGVPSGSEVDFMSGSIIGAEGRWDPFVESGDPETTIYDRPDKPPVWRVSAADELLPDTTSQMFNADLALGLFVQRQIDFQLNGEFPLQFARVYRNQDDKSRSFGIGASDSLDIFLIGQMGKYGELILADGGRIHFDHSSKSIDDGDTYLPRDGQYSSLVYKGDIWTLTRKDGWKFYMPYRAQALPQNVTVLTGFSDPAGNMYAMNRNSFGDLLSITTPTGAWLHFQRDSAHRVRRIEASTGRIVEYEYDSAGCLSRVSDSDRHTMLYTYDDKKQMQTISRGVNALVLTNTYDDHGYLQTQTMADGQKFEYHYAQAADGKSTVPDLITAPNRFLTHIRYQAGNYTFSLPMHPPQ